MKKNFPLCIFLQTLLIGQIINCSDEMPANSSCLQTIYSFLFGSINTKKNNTIDDELNEKCYEKNRQKLIDSRKSRDPINPLLLLTTPKTTCNKQPNTPIYARASKTPELNTIEEEEEE